MWGVALLGHGEVDGKGCAEPGERRRDDVVAVEEAADPVPERRRVEVV